MLWEAGNPFREKFDCLVSIYKVFSNVNRRYSVSLYNEILVTSLKKENVCNQFVSPNTITLIEFALIMRWGIEKRRDLQLA